jgi:uncharacterized membrane protein
MFSDSFAGTVPASVPLFAAMQLTGGLVAVVLARGLYPPAAPVTARSTEVDTVLGTEPAADMSPARD